MKFSCHAPWWGSMINDSRCMKCNSTTSYPEQLDMGINRIPPWYFEQNTHHCYEQIMYLCGQQYINILYHMQALIWFPRTLCFWIILINDIVIVQIHTFIFHIYVIIQVQLWFIGSITIIIIIIIISVIINESNDIIWYCYLLRKLIDLNISSLINENVYFCNDRNDIIHALND